MFKIDWKTIVKEEYYKMVSKLEEDQEGQSLFHFDLTRGEHSCIREEYQHLLLPYMEQNNLLKSNSRRNLERKMLLAK